jgi:hypothetical protein
MLAPFENESQVVELGGLTIENRTDRVSLHGALDLTRDKPGLERARTLKALLESVVARLEAEEAALPESVATAAPGTGRNPFE